jgi:hypothetical protein
MVAVAVELTAAAEYAMALSSTSPSRDVVLALQDVSLLVEMQPFCASITAEEKSLAVLPRKTLSNGNLELEIMQGLPATSQCA